MDNIQKTLDQADKLGLKQQLINWVVDNKDWDPSLYQDIERYYDIGLKILTDTDTQKNLDSFDKGYWKTKGHTKPKEGERLMPSLLDSYSLMHQTNSFLELEMYSQIGQDLFVINLLKQKRNGLFLDIGGGPPKFISNTYLLETKYDWTGVSIDLDHRNKVAWQNSGRTSKFLYEDAFEIDYNTLITQMLNEHGRDRIDYFSLDLEPPNLTLEALFKVMTSTKHRFTVITFEHDAWRGYEHVIKASRELMEAHDYQLVVDNINNQEDWYIDKTY